jgi:hypothetical protein
MVKIFIPKNKGKEKTLTRGFWYSQENKKIYYDYLNILNYNIPFENLNYKEIENIKLKYNQESIFIISKNKGYIFYNKNKIDILNKRDIIKIKIQGKNRKLLKEYIKSLLKLYGGLTVYIKKFDYILECYHN